MPRHRPATDLVKLPQGRLLDYPHFMKALQLLGGSMCILKSPNGSRPLSHLTALKCCWNSPTSQNCDDHCLDQRLPTATNGTFAYSKGIILKIWQTFRPFWSLTSLEASADSNYQAQITIRWIFLSFQLTIWAQFRFFHFQKISTTANLKKKGEGNFWSSERLWNVVVAPRWALQQPPRRTSSPLVVGGKAFKVWTSSVTLRKNGKNEGVSAGKQYLNKWKKLRKTWKIPRKLQHTP